MMYLLSLHSRGLFLGVFLLWWWLLWCIHDVSGPLGGGRWIFWHQLPPQALPRACEVIFQVQAAQARNSRCGCLQAAPHICYEGLDCCIHVPLPCSCVYERYGAFKRGTTRWAGASVANVGSSCIPSVIMPGASVANGAKYRRAISVYSSDGTGLSLKFYLPYPPFNMGGNMNSTTFLANMTTLLSQMEDLEKDLASCSTPQRTHICLGALIPHVIFTGLSCR